MTPAARVEAASELLDAIIVAARDGGAAADVLATQFFRSRRYAGSKDRRAIRDLAWAAIRRFGERPGSGRAALVALADADPQLAALFDGSAHAPAPIAPGEPRASAGRLPAVARGLLYPFIDDAEVIAMLARAPLDLRIIRNDAELPAGESLPAPLHGLRLPPDTPILDHPAYVAGAVEVQDAGSQWIVAACGAATGMRIVDLCAGAGGKTLALAAAMDGSGQVTACDIDRRRLQQLAPRVARTGLSGIDTRLLDPKREAEALADLNAAADLVLVDAPCSGSGTWRRNPETRWRLTAPRIERVVAEQGRLIRIGAALVRPGGHLVYAVCALTRAEGAEQVEAFLAHYPGWVVEDVHATGLIPAGVGRRVGAGLVLTPAHDATDGFFFARLRAPC